jgi:amino acid adenylation domain-containing protein
MELAPNRVGNAAGYVRAAAIQLKEIRQMDGSGNRKSSQQAGMEHPAALVHHLFELQAARNPETVAVTCGEQMLTYGELNRRANRFAHTLTALGLRTEDRVVLYLSRGVEAVVSMLGVLKAGGTYVPLDVSYPAARVEYIVRDCAPVVIVTGSQFSNSLPNCDAKVIVIDAARDVFRAQPDTDPAPDDMGLAPHTSAYVIYTSGSTGKPKGVVVEHRNITNMIDWHCKRFDVRSGTRCSAVASFGFDASVWEILSPLCAGATLALAPPETAGDPNCLLTWWGQQDLDVSFLPTPIAELAFRRCRYSARLRYVLIGGDRLRSQPGRHSFEVINNYGPTECTVLATSGPIREEDLVLHIGGPIANTQIHILDEAHRPVSAGESGEIYIGGACVARGYLNRRDLTADRFVADPFSVQPDARMYRTGDLGRWLPNGTIEFLGRNDEQVKIHGNRIELGEVEAHLLQHPGVKEAVVAARPDTRGDVRLVGYVVLNSEHDVTPLSVRDFLMERLPPYMVPTAIVALEQFPLTPNGKIDRQALPEPAIDALSGRPYEVPRGLAEESLARIWGELLRVDRVGRADSFFELGGHSLLAVSMMERIRQSGYSAEVPNVLKSATLAEMASVLQPSTDATRPADTQPLVQLDAKQIDRISRAVPGGADNIQDIYPLTPLQQGMLFHHLLEAKQGVDTYVLSTLFVATSREDLGRLTAALQHVVDRHDALRSSIFWEELPCAVQVVHRHVVMPVDELHFEPGADLLAELRKRMQPGYQILNLHSAPLMKLQVAVDDQKQQYYALLQMHHLTCDANSLETLLSEVTACVVGKAAELPQPRPYRDHVAEALLYGQKQDVDAFFRSRLADVEEPTAPFGVLDVQGGASRIVQARQTLDLGLADRIRILARRANVSAATLFHAAWALVVAATSGRDDVVFGTVLLGRLQSRAGTDAMLGMFINTLPIRIDLKSLDVQGLVQNTQRELIELLSHEHASLSEVQRYSGISGSAPLFTALLNYRRGKRDGCDAVRVVDVKAWTNYPILLSIDDVDDRFDLAMDTDCQIDPQWLLDSMTVVLGSITDALDSDPRRISLDLEVLPQAERIRVIQTFNATERPRSRDRVVHELFEEQARQSPQSIAVMHEQLQIRFGELNERANQLARYLVNQGVEPGQLVGICVQRGINLVIGVIAVLKAGGAYVPLDPNYPPDRLKYMVEDAAPKVILTETELSPLLPDFDAQIIPLSAALEKVSGYIHEDLASAQIGLTSERPAYVIYTSGSTGTPKGTSMPHGAMVNLMEWHRTEFPISAGQRVLQYAALSFDVAFQEIFSTLCTGGTLVLLDEWTRRDAKALTETLTRQAVNRIFLPPLMFQSLAEYSNGAGTVVSGLQDVITAGEQLRVTGEVTQFIERNPGCRLHNHYGPTETHVVTALTLSGDPRQWPALPTIGRPIANSRIYILSNRCRPVPVGVVGEIFIAGECVAHGYIGQPMLTSQRFLTDPFNEQSRMYKTGDLGRWRADGTIEYLGRNDHQVKIRGFRIELGEIEARLEDHPEVKEAVVIAREDAPGQKRLVAYVVPRQADGASVEVLRDHLKGALPEYMVPSAFVRLEELPLSPNGKLDRKALPAPDLGAYTSREYEAPQGQMEEILAGIWQSLLGVERVGRADNFFVLGGHSLLIVQMLERLRRVGLSTEVRRVFQSPTLAELAGGLGDEVAGQLEVPPNRIPSQCKAITPDMLPLVQLEPEHIARIVAAVPGGATNIQDIYPLAPLQEGILFHYLLDENSYLLPLLLSFPSEDIRKHLVAALQQVVNRHDVLRTAVLWDGLPRPLQVVYRQATLTVTDLTLESDRDALAQLKERMALDNASFDLRKAPLLNVQVVNPAVNGQWYLVLRLHHILCDHESLVTMIEEAMAHVEGRANELPVSIPYRNHVAQSLAHADKHDAAAFFRKKLGDIEEPTAPFGLQNVRGDGTRIREARRWLEPSLGERIRKQARRMSVSAATLFHAGWGLVLAHTTGRTDVVFGTVLLGRLQGAAGAQRVLGMFINTLPLRLTLEAKTTRELVDHTQREIIELLTHEQASLAVAQRCSGIAGGSPLFASLFNYRHSPHEPELASVAGVKLLAEVDRTNYPITLSIDDQGSQFALTTQTDLQLEPERVMDFLSTAMQSLVSALEATRDSPALSLSILPESEKRQVIELFNPTRNYVNDRLIHELFEARVRQNPAATAVTCEGQSLTYAELNSNANQVARYLRLQGVRPDGFVGLCVERSLNMVVGLLGILKAGGAYVPLDPNAPPERLAHIIKDAALKRVLTQSNLKERLAAPDLDLIALDTDWEKIAQGPVTDLQLRPVGLSSRNLAYVIYTSGSTGTPKGVMVEHRNVTRLFSSTEELYDFGSQDVWTLFHSIAFDFSVWELWGALLYGGRLVVVPHQVARSPQAFYHLLCQEQVTVLNQTPSAFTQLAEEQGRAPELKHSLRYVIFGGEALDLPKLQTWVDLNGDAHPQLVNMYGITETTVHVTHTVISAQQIADERTSPVGKALSDLRTYLFNSQRQPVPIGVVGEIYVAGAGVARGYLNRPELTTERFIQDPFDPDPSARMYKSGDLARWRADGTLDYLGRNDQQVKIRGFRIELGEIEARVAQHPLVEQAVVIVREDTPGDRRLVAYVKSRSASLSLDDLRAHLKPTLPEYMIPSAFVRLDTLPLTANGKLDHRALPQPDVEAYSGIEYEAPQGEVEEFLAAIWREILGAERVGRQDEFFNLGGHSLSAMQVIVRIRAELSVSLPMKVIFECPVLWRLAQRVDEGLLEAVSSMPESEVNQWVRELRMGTGND